MTDHEEQNPGSLLKVLVNAWKLSRPASEAAQQRSESGAAATDAESSSQTAHIRRGAWFVLAASLVWRGGKALSGLVRGPATPESPVDVENAGKGKWLVLGALLSWKAGKSLAKSASHTLLQEPAETARADAPHEHAGLDALRASAAAGHALDRMLAGTTPVEDLPSTGRQSDRNLDRENEVNLERREKWGTFLATLATLSGVAGGIGFVVTFWTGGPNEWLGNSLAVFLGGFGLAMVLWAHWLTAHKEAVEPRERVSSPLPEQEGAAREFLTGASDIQRRRLLQWMGLAGAGALGAMVISLIRSLGFPPRFALDTDVWKAGQRLVTVDGIPVGVDALPPGGMIIVFPENAIGSEKTQTVLVRVHQDLLQLPPQRSTWAPGGNLAYSRICTHAGCSVGMYEANTHMLMCPCHQSTFNVLTGAQPTGGPAARPLPQLPLTVDSAGHLRAAGGLSDYPGPGFWGMPS